MTRHQRIAQARAAGKHKPAAQAKSSGWRHSISTTSKKNLDRRILTGKRRASRYYRLAKAQLTEHELEEEMR